MAKERHDLPTPFLFSGWDRALLLLGVLGVVVFLWLLPRVHPDATADYEISKEEAINAADAFLISQGHEISDLLPSAALTRREDLLFSLQHVLGRNSTVGFLSTENRYVVPAYYWLVQYRPAPDADQSLLISEQGAVLEVELAQDGTRLALRNLGSRTGMRDGSQELRVNRAALARVTHADSIADEAARTVLAQIADSVFQKALSFDLSQTNSVAAQETLNALQQGRRTTLDSTDVALIGTYHLRNSAFRNVGLRVDSVEVPNGSRGRMARIGFEAERPIAGQRIRVDITVSSTGILTRMSPSFETAQPIVDTASRALQAVKVVLFALLALGFVVVFLRRLSAQLLDLKAALVDAMIIGILGGIVTATSTTFLSDVFFYAPLWGEFLIRLIVFSIVAGAISLFVFMLAGVTDSVVRENEEGKLGTLILLRHGDFHNKPTGAALVRGAALGGILLGLGAAALALFEHLHLDLGPDFLSNAVFRPVLSGVFGGLETAYFLTLLWVVGVSSVVRHMSDRTVVTVALLTVTGAFIGAGPVTFETQILGLLWGGFSALVLAIAWIRYDILTVLTALFISEVMWQLNEGYLVGGTPAWIDVLLGGLFLMSLLIVGFVGISSRQTGLQATTYVPEIGRAHV